MTTSDPVRHDFAPHPSSDTLNAALAAEHGGTCLLSFSCGKDSIAAWLALRPHFARIVPVYCYLVPGLGFVERALTYYERFFGTRIVRLPHPQLYHWLNVGLFQPPHRLPAIRQADLPEFGMDDVFRVAREDLGLPATTPTAIGVLASDTPMRRANVRRMGPQNRRRNTWYPIYDWTGDQRRQAIVRAGVALPPDYAMFGRSFDGLQALFVDAIRAHYPEDYDIIRQWFPLIGASHTREVLRRSVAPTADIEATS